MDQRLSAGRIHPPGRSNAMGDTTSDYMTRKEAATHITRCGIHISVSTLNKYARLGMGPEFVRPSETTYGRTFYSKAAIEAWLDRVDPKRKGAR
jgi:hypothetical protein